MSASATDALGSPWLRGRAKLRRLVLVARLDGARVLGAVVRRLIDVALGATGIVLTSPIVGLAVLAILVESPGPAVFRQIRVGKHGRPFVLRKLRSMRLDAEARRESLEAQNEAKGGVTFKIRKDPRITRVGAILRKLSIDELPQLLNLVDGSMTLLGPRPPIPAEVERYGARERRRLEVTPGLTCFWQVAGRSDLSFVEQVELDIRYVDRATLRDEVEIVARTVPAVVLGKGAY